MEIARRLARHRLVAVDTCVFIYLMERNPRYFNAASAIFESIESGKSPAATSTVVLTEILAQPYRNENLAQAEAFYGLLTTLPNLEWVPPSLRIANILRDQEILEAARNAAAEFIEKPPSSAEFAQAMEYVHGHWQRRFGLVEVG